MKKGFTLIELMVALGVSGSVALINHNEGLLESTQVEARSLGNEIYQHNAAVGRFLAVAASDPSSVGITPSTPIVRSGSNWLKSSTCGAGTSSVDYLDCNALPNGRTLKFQSEPTTTISEDSSGRLQARTVWSPAIGSNGSPDPLVMGLASLVASGNYATQAGDDAGGYQNPTVFCPDVSSYSSAISTICSTDRNRIISSVSLNSSLEPWLRTDHANTMNHAIEFGASPSDQGDIDSIDDGGSAGSWSGSGMRQIINVARLYNIGGSSSDSIVIGQLGGKSIFTDSFLTSRGLLTQSIIMDGDAGVMNDLYVKGETFLLDDLDVDGNINASNDILASRDIVASRDVRSSRDVIASDDLIAGDDIVSNNGDIVSSNGQVRGGYVRSTGDVRADRYSYAQRFYDQNNGSYYIDPASRSNVNSITATGDVRAGIFYDRDNTSRYLNPSSRSVVNAITATSDIRATVFYDQNNTGYRGDFSGSSRMNYIDSDSFRSRGRLRTDEYLHLNRSVSVGGGCSPNGLVGRTSTGELASCVSGRWRKSGGGGSLSCYQQSVGYDTPSNLVTSSRCRSGYTMVSFDSSGRSGRDQAGGNSVGDVRSWQSCCQITN